jgi:hypothetical protein
MYPIGIGHLNILDTIRLVVSSFVSIIISGVILPGCQYLVFEYPGAEIKN